eukprot:1195792-Prorocentrum_minimum.AAC.1
MQSLNIITTQPGDSKDVMRGSPGRYIFPRHASLSWARGSTRYLRNETEMCHFALERSSYVRESQNESNFVCASQRVGLNLQPLLSDSSYLSLNLRDRRSTESAVDSGPLTGVRV